MDDPASLRDQLAPLADGLISVAQERAAVIVREAQASADILKREAQKKIARIDAAARADGRRRAEREAARALAAARRSARQTVFDARREAYESAKRSAHDQVERLRHEETYPDLERGLTAAARRVLGTDAEVEHNPDGRGGVIARTHNRVLDLTLPTLAERCFGRLGAAVERLWS